LNKKQLKLHLDDLYSKTAHQGFIEDDPISIPYQFSKKEDIEIAGFFAAIFAWGQRVTIINKTKDLLQRMDDAPYDFILNHEEQDRKALFGFKHRTFNDTDLIYFAHRLQRFYKEDGGLEPAFAVDLGIWKKIRPSQLMMPLDVHVERMARDLKLVERKQRDWKTVNQLTNNLRKLDPTDPVKYDLALFGASVMNIA